jgi:hypothetical protein
MVAHPQPLRWTTWATDADEEQPEVVNDTPTTPVTGASSAAVHADVAQTAPSPDTLVPVYGPLRLSQPWAKARRRFSAQAFQLQEDDTLRCPQGKVVRPRERRVLENGDLRVLYAAKMHDCRTCPVAGDCLGRGASGDQPRRVSGVRPRTGWQLPPTLHAPQPPSAPEPQPVAREPERPTLRWCDCGGRRVRRDLVRQLRRQQVTLAEHAQEPEPMAAPAGPQVMAKAERAHRRRSWADRLARNAADVPSPGWRVQLPGVPTALAASLGLPSAAAP